MYIYNQNKLKLLSKNKKLEYVNVEEKLKKLSGDLWVGTLNQKTAKSLINQISTYRYSDKQLYLIESLLTTYIGG